MRPVEVEILEVGRPVGLMYCMVVLRREQWQTEGSTVEEDIWIWRRGIDESVELGFDLGIRTAV